MVEEVTTAGLEEIQSGAGLRGIVAGTARVLGAPVVLVTRQRRVVASAGLNDTDETLAVAREASLTVTVQVRGMSWGGLSTVGEVSEEAEAALRRAAAFIELELLHSSEPIEAEERAHREMLVNLLAGTPDRAEVTARAGPLAYALSVELPLFAVAAVAVDLDSTALEAALSKAGLAAVWTRLDQDVLVLGAARERAGAATTVEQFAVDLVSRMRGGSGEVRLSVSEPAVDLAGAGLRLREARDALHVALAIGGDSAIVRSRDLLVDRVLARAVTERDLADGLVAELEPLLELPRRSAQVLTRTLRVFLDSGASKTVAAERLGVRRQSLYRRLSRIEELIGPFDSAERQLVLHLALRAPIAQDRTR